MAVVDNKLAQAGMLFGAGSDTVVGGQQPTSPAVTDGAPQTALGLLKSAREGGRRTNELAKARTAENKQRLQALLDNAGTGTQGLFNTAAVGLGNFLGKKASKESDDAEMQFAKEADSVEASALESIAENPEDPKNYFAAFSAIAPYDPETALFYLEQGNALQLLDIQRTEAAAAVAAATQIDPPPITKISDSELDQSGIALAQAFNITDLKSIPQNVRYKVAQEVRRLEGQVDEDSAIARDRDSLYQMAVQNLQDRNVFERNSSLIGSASITLTQDPETTPPATVGTVENKNQAQIEGERMGGIVFDPYDTELANKLYQSIK